MRGEKSTFIQSAPTFFSDHAAKIGCRARHVHSALQRDVRIRHSRREQFAYRAKQKCIPGPHRCPPPRFQEGFQLLEYGVLQDRVDD